VELFQLLFAISLMDESPSEVSEEQLEELHIKLREKKDNKN
jgi:aspartyl-tRNA synthetase